MFWKVLWYVSQHDSAVWRFLEATTITHNSKLYLVSRILRLSCFSLYTCKQIKITHKSSQYCQSAITFTLVLLCHDAITINTQTEFTCEEETARERGKGRGEGKGRGNYISPMNFLTLSRSFSSLKCNGVSRAFNCQQGLSLKRLPFFPFQHSCSHEIFFLSSEIHIKQKH